MTTRKETPDILGAVLGGPLQARSLRIADIRRDGGTQPRDGVREPLVAEYARLMQDDVDLGPVDVMYDGTSYWLYDGYHRTAAAESIGRYTMMAVVHMGTQTDAQWESYGANKAHGLNRTHEDKERAVKAALRHPKGPQTSDSQLAKHVGVDHKTVAKYREEMESILGIPKIDERTVTRNGTTYTQNTANIGAKPACDNTPIYQTVAQLEEQVRSFAPVYYSGPGELLGAPANMRACVKVTGGEFWWMICKQTAGFKPGDLAKAILNVAAEMEWAQVEAAPAPTDDKKLVEWTDEDWAASEARKQEGARKERERLAMYDENSRAFEAHMAEVRASLHPVDDKPGKPMISIPMSAEERDIAEREAAADLAAAQYEEQAEMERKAAAKAEEDAILRPVPISKRDGYESDEWYTPAEYIEAARLVMGAIDLDPASCELAQTVVKATCYLTKLEDGLAQSRWLHERVWLNPPYGGPEAWISKLLMEFDNGTFVKQAVVLLNNNTETGYFQSLLARFPVCLLSRRIPFWRDDQSGETARQGQAIFYLGPNVDRFVEVFGMLGPVVRRIG